jgi:glycosyltransferase involved in cell wall biosynthesis
VRHVGYVDPAAARAYADAICLVQRPSKKDQHHGPEAMAAGVPVVVTDRGALPEVTGGAGEVVSADELDELPPRLNG